MAITYKTLNERNLNSPVADAYFALYIDFHPNLAGISKEAHLREEISGARNYRIAFDGTEPVGWIMFFVEAVNNPRIPDRKIFTTAQTYVARAHRKKGLATRMSQDFIRFAYGSGVSMVKRVMQNEQMMGVARKLKSRSPDNRRILIRVRNEDVMLALR